MTFQQAVAETPDISNCYQNGLQALGTYSNKIDLTDRRLCEGSVDIDSCVLNNYPGQNRWDYAFSYNSEVYFVEVHSANTSEVSTVLRKLQWLKDWLNYHAPEINRLKAKGQPFYWIQSGKFAIASTSPQYRRVVQEGLRPIPKLSL